MIRYSYTKGYKPTPAQLMQEDLLINVADQLIYAKGRDGIVKEIGGGTVGDASFNSAVYSAIKTYNQSNEAEGLITFMWVKYADDSSGTNMTDDPTAKSWMGVAYNKTTATESNDPDDYSWSYLGGVDGVDGTDGTDGTDGNTFFSVGTATGLWSDTTAYNTVYNELGFVPDYAVVTIYEIGDPTDAITKYYLDGSWYTSAFTVHGDMVVDGTIVADHIAADSITASKMDTDALSTCRFYVSDTNTDYSIYRSYFTSYGSSVTGGFYNSNPASSSRAIYASHTGISGTLTAGVWGKCTNGTGVQGETGSAGYAGIAGTALGSSNYGVTGSNPSGYGLHTEDDCWFEGGNYPFTAGHSTFSAQTMSIGDILVVTDAEIINVDNVIIKSELSSTANDPNVYGVLHKERDAEVTLKTFKALTEPIDAQEGQRQRQFTSEWENFANDIINTTNMNACMTNSIGEGGINVCEIGGDIDKGDYITSSTVTGKGQKQSDDILHSYTVAKATEAVDWATETVGVDGCFTFQGYKCKMIACTYHCG